MIYDGHDDGGGDDDNISGCPLRDTVYQRISAIMPTCIHTQVRFSFAHVQYTINVHHSHFGKLFLCALSRACLFGAMASSLEQLARRAQKAAARTKEPN